MYLFESLLELEPCSTRTRPSKNKKKNTVKLQAKHEILKTALACRKMVCVSIRNDVTRFS